MDLSADSGEYWKDEILENAHSDGYAYVTEKPGHQGYFLQNTLYHNTGSKIGIK
jgi:hypothetical protein